MMYYDVLTCLSFKKTTVLSNPVFQNMTLSEKLILKKTQRLIES
jgi:hypothetical protein